MRYWSSVVSRNHSPSFPFHKLKLESFRPPVGSSAHRQQLGQGSDISTSLERNELRGSWTGFGLQILRVYLAVAVKVSGGVK